MLRARTRTPLGARRGEEMGEIKTTGTIASWPPIAALDPGIVSGRYPGSRIEGGARPSSSAGAFPLCAVACVPADQFAYRCGGSVGMARFASAPTSRFIPRNECLAEHQRRGSTSVADSTHGSCWQQGQALFYS